MLFPLDCKICNCNLACTVKLSLTKKVLALKKNSFLISHLIDIPKSNWKHESARLILLNLQSQTCKIPLTPKSNWMSRNKSCVSLHVLSQSKENCYHFFFVQDERIQKCTIISFDSVIFTFLHEALFEQKSHEKWSQMSHLSDFFCVCPQFRLRIYVNQNYLAIFMKMIQITFPLTIRKKSPKRNQK